MIYFLSKTLDVLLSPLAWVLVLLVLSFASQKLQQYRSTLIAASVMVLYLSSIAPVKNYLWLALEKDSLKLPSDPEKHDVIVLLGGMVDHAPTETHGVRSYNGNIERLLVTFELLRKNPHQKVIISGGKSRDSAPVVEATTVAGQLVDWGIRRDRILIEDRAINTRQNALYVAETVREHGYERPLMITSAFHMPRALDCFREVGLAVDPYPVDYQSVKPGLAAELLPRGEHLAGTERAVRELAGRYIYRILGYGSATMQAPPKTVSEPTQPAKGAMLQ